MLHLSVSLIFRVRLNMFSPLGRLRKPYGQRPEKLQLRRTSRMKTENIKKTKVTKTGIPTEKEEVGAEVEVEGGPVGVGELGEEVEGKAPPRLKRLNRRMNRMTIRTTMTRVRMRQTIGRENGNQGQWKGLAELQLANLDLIRLEWHRKIILMRRLGMVHKHCDTGVLHTVFICGCRTSVHVCCMSISILYMRCQSTWQVRQNLEIVRGIAKEDPMMILPSDEVLQKRTYFA